MNKVLLLSLSSFQLITNFFQDIVVSHKKIASRVFIVNLEMLADFFTVLTWPVPHLTSAFKLKGNEPSPVLKTGPTFTISGHFAAFGASLRNFFIACFLIFGLYPDDSYPAFGRAKTFQLSWMWPIIFRNILGTWLICGFWDWWLYFGPKREALFKYKIFPKYPSFRQMRHDFLFTTLSSFIAGVIEIGVCYGYANGLLPMANSLMDKPLLHLILALTITHWRIPHFF